MIEISTGPYGSHGSEVMGREPILSADETRYGSFGRTPFSVRQNQRLLGAAFARRLNETCMVFPGAISGESSRETTVTADGQVTVTLHRDHRNGKYIAVGVYCGDVGGVTVSDITTQESPITPDEAAQADWLMGEMYPD